MPGLRLLSEYQSKTQTEAYVMQFKAFPSKGINHYKMQFVPMIWGNNGTFNFYNTVKGLIDSGMDIEYVSLSHILTSASDDLERFAK